MKKNGIGLLITLVLITVAIGLIAMSANSRILIIPMFICGALAINGIFYIPNNPPHVGIKTIWGKRTDTFLDEGLNFLFLRGIVNNCILIDVTKKNIDFDEQTLTTPDNATTKVKSSISYTPDKDHIINYLNVGGEVGVNHMIQDIEEEKLRIWSRSKTEGPQTWEQMNDAAEEAVKVIISEICGQIIPDTDIKNIRKGDGKWSIPHLGIILNRYNLTKMETFGKVYEASIALEKERKERKSESYEIKTELSKAKILKKELASNGVIKSLDEVIQLMMKWKIEREANSLVSLSAIAKIIAGSMKGGQS